MLFVPVMSFVDDGVSYTFNVNLLATSTDSAVIVPAWTMVVSASLASLLSVFAIFLYKNRLLQIKMAYIVLLCIVIHIAAAAFYMNVFVPMLSFLLSSALMLPVAAILLDVLAITRIRKDENLVKSLDRIR